MNVTEKQLQYLRSNTDNVQKTGTRVTANVTIRSTGPVILTATVPDRSTSITVTDVSCIPGHVEIMTKRGPVRAEFVTMDDELMQLNFQFSKIKSIKTSFFANGTGTKSLFECPNGKVSFTEWHPVKLLGENVYTVAKLHPYLTERRIPKNEQSFYVYNFELESVINVILFIHDISLVAESWNDLPHGESVK